MRYLAVLMMGLWYPVVANADALVLEEFAVFQGPVSEETAAPVRRQIVECLQSTQAPRSCVGATVPQCDGDAGTCVAIEATVWEQYGYDIYLALRRALGGPSWIDEAHMRLGSEMVARCDAHVIEAGESARGGCEMREAAGRALDLRFALVAP